MLLLASLSLPLGVLAQPRVTTEAFLSPTGFDFVDGVDDLRFAELASNGNTEDSTHLLIQGLVPVEEGSNVVTSGYTAINLATGDELEVGQLYFTMPEGATPPDGASSPIVGIVARDGSWSDFNPTEPPTDLGGASGWLGIDADAQTLSISVEIDGTVYTGTASYTRVDDSTIELADFSLSSGTNTVEFHGTQLFHYGTYLGDYYGVIQVKGDASDLDSLMYAIRLHRTPDFDGDTVPDLSDAETGAFQPVLDAWKYDNGTGWIWGITEEWGYSLIFGNVFVVHYPWLWVHNHGYVYFALRAGEIVWVWDHERQQYLYTGDFGGHYGVHGETPAWGHRFYE